MLPGPASGNRQPPGQARPRRDRGCPARPEQPGRQLRAACGLGNGLQVTVGVHHPRSQPHKGGNPEEFPVSPAAAGIRAGKRPAGTRPAPWGYLPRGNPRVLFLQADTPVSTVGYIEQFAAFDPPRGKGGPRVVADVSSISERG